MLTLAGIGVALAACGGQSAQQKLVSKCKAEAQTWAENFVAPENSAQANRDIPGLAQSAAQACIDSGKPPGP